MSAYTGQQGSVSLKTVGPLVILSTEKTAMVAKVISELRAVSRLKICFY